VSQPIYLYHEQEGVPTYLTQVGTLRDIASFGIILEEGIRLTFYDIDGSDSGEAGRLMFEGTVHWDQSKGKWYALLDSASFRFEPDRPVASGTDAQAGIV
jgi:hypothetical protein